MNTFINEKKLHIFWIFKRGLKFKRFLRLESCLLITDNQKMPMIIVTT